MWFIGVEVEQETSAPPPKKNPGSAPEERVATTKLLRSKRILPGLLALHHIEVPAKEA